MKFLGVTILQGVEFSIFPIDFELALQQCSATALPVILHTCEKISTILLPVKLVKTRLTRCSDWLKEDVADSQEWDHKFRSCNSPVTSLTACLFVYSCRRVQWLLSSFCCLLFWLHSIQCCRQWPRRRRRKALSFSSVVPSPAEHASFTLLYRTCNFPIDWLMLPISVRCDLMSGVMRQHTFRGIWDTFRQVRNCSSYIC